MRTVFVVQVSNKVALSVYTPFVRFVKGPILIECLALTRRKSGVPSRVGCATELERVQVLDVSLLHGFWPQSSLSYSYGAA
jgi:hypothetical protein